MIDPCTPGFWVPAHLLAGGFAYLADLRFGVGLRGWCLDLLAPEPGEHHQGFLVERSPGTQLGWSLALASALGMVMVLAAAAPPLRQVAVAACGTLVCFLGIQAGALVVLGVRGLGDARARLGELGGRVREGAPRLLEDGRQAARCLLERLPELPRAPAVDPVRLRQEKIARMDALLGRPSHDAEDR